MFCSKCGFQVADGAAFCPICGNKIEVAPVAPAQPVYQAPVAPVAPAQPVYQAPVAPVAPAQPVYQAPVAPVAPAQPVYQTPVYETPAYAAPVATQPAPKKNLTWLWILLGVLIVAGITIGVLFATGVLGDQSKDEGGVANDPEAVAKAYVEAQFEGDIETLLQLMLGEYQKYYEEELYGDDDDTEAMFEQYEDYADELDIDVTIEDWDDYYSARKKIGKAENEQEYGEGYRLTVEVEHTEEMDEDTLDYIYRIFKSDDYSSYIDTDKIEEGKSIVVNVSINNDEGEELETREIQMELVKYDGQWKFATAH